MLYDNRFHAVGFFVYKHRHSMKMLKTKSILNLSFSAMRSNVRSLSSNHSTVDQLEITHYGKLASNWWDTAIPLHSLNMLRVPFIRDGILQTRNPALAHQNNSRPLSGFSILEVGCGGGILTEPLQRCGASMTGIDSSKDMIEIATLHASKDPSVADIQYINSAIEDHVHSHENCYDAVVVSEVLEHVVEKDLFMQCCSSVLKPGGSIFVTTLNRTRATYIFGIIFAEYILQFIPKGTHEIDKCITPTEVQVLFEKYGMVTLLKHGLYYNFINNTWHWCNYQGICYAMQAVKK